MRDAFLLLIFIMATSYKLNTSPYALGLVLVYHITGGGSSVYSYIMKSHTNTPSIRIGTYPCIRFKF